MRSRFHDVWRHDDLISVSCVSWKQICFSRELPQCSVPQTHALYDRFPYFTTKLCSPCTLVQQSVNKRKFITSQHRHRDNKLGQLARYFIRIDIKIRQNCCVWRDADISERVGCVVVHDGGPEDDQTVLWTVSSAAANEAHHPFHRFALQSIHVVISRTTPRLLSFALCLEWINGIIHCRHWLSRLL